MEFCPTSTRVLVMCNPGWGARPKVDMSRQDQTESAYVQTVPDSKCLCPDRPRLKVPMSRPSHTESGYVQTIVRSKLFVCSSCVRRQNMSRPSQTETIYVQTFVRFRPDHRALHIKVVRSTPKFKCVHVQTNVRSCPDFRVFTRPKKIASCGAVLILEDEDREGSKIPQIQIFKVYQKICFWITFSIRLSEKSTPQPRFLRSCGYLLSNYTCIFLGFWNLVVIYYQIILAFCIYLQ